MSDQEKTRKNQQRAARDKHLNEIEESLDRVSKLVEDSQREIQRSRDLLHGRRNQDKRDEQAEDGRGS